MPSTSGPSGHSPSGEGPSGEGPPPPWAPLVAALQAYQAGDHGATLTVRDSLGNREPLAASYFFRTLAERDDDPLLALERTALELCRGHVLDVGAGAGGHTLELERRGLRVTALEPEPGLVELLRERGVRDPRLGTPAALEGEHFDTLLLLMNGWGLAGTLADLPHFLDELAGVLAPGGQVLADSSDLRPLLDPDGEEEAARRATSDPAEYLGDIEYRLEFAGIRGGPFSFLFVDPDALAQVAGERGWVVEILARNDEEGYLSRLTR